MKSKTNHEEFLDLLTLTKSSTYSAVVLFLCYYQKTSQYKFQLTFKFQIKDYDGFTSLPHQKKKSPSNISQIFENIIIISTSKFH